MPPSAEPTAPAQETAATAVTRLAGERPGRHICYRVYLEDDGWQKPVCDGAAAGEVNGDQKVKSMNIAVSGTAGTSANAFVHKDGWKTAWSSVGDGADNYIGSTEQDAPHMLGFAIAVPEGKVCQEASTRTRGWLGQLCAEQDDYIFGGSINDERWLEAVRLTV
jgi:hypothetical protein